MTLPHYVRTAAYSLTLFLFLGVVGCEDSTTTFEEPVLADLETSVQPDTIMAHTVAQVKTMRQQSGIDQRAMAIDGVISVGTSGNSNDDAWIQILVKDTLAAERARGVLGDSLEGIPIKFAYSDTVRAQ